MAILVDRKSLKLLGRLRRRLLLRCPHLPHSFCLGLAPRGGEGAASLFRRGRCCRYRRGALRWTTPAFHRSLKGFNGAIEFVSLCDQQGEDLVCWHRENRSTVDDPGPGLQISIPATGDSLDNHRTARSGTAIPAAQSSRLATAIASLMSRSIASSPRSAFRNMQSCMGRKRKSSTTLPRLSAESVFRSTGT